MTRWSEVAFAWTQLGNSNSNSAVQDPPPNPVGTRQTRKYFSELLLKYLRIGRICI